MVHTMTPRKSSKKTFPFIDDKRILSPLRAGNEKSRRGSVIFGVTCAAAFTATIKKQKTKKFFRRIII